MGKEIKTPGREGLGQGHLRHSLGILLFSEAGPELALALGGGGVVCGIP